MFSLRDRERANGEKGKRREQFEQRISEHRPYHHEMFPGTDAHKSVHRKREKQRFKAVFERAASRGTHHFAV